MRTRLAAPFAMGFLALALSPAYGGTTPDLTDDSFESIRASILSTPAEERWREIPWRTSTWDAVVEASVTDRPVLLWAMNGHPLACT
jgi:hypothetical protein